MIFVMSSEVETSLEVSPIEKKLEIPRLRSE